MASEGQITSSDSDQARSPHGGASATLGLIAAPDIPEKIAKEIAPELPELLGRHVDSRPSWDISVVVDPLTGTNREAPEILDACQERLRQEGWDLAVCLTDLPVYRSGRLVVADVSAARKVAELSLPVLGATRLRPRAREAILRLVAELYARSPQPGQDDASPEGEERYPDADDRTSDLPAQGSNRLVGLRPVELIAPFRRVEPPDEDMKAIDVDARFAAPGALGHVRLWSGMVLANRPWKMLPAFKGAIAAAFATGAYALIIPSIRMLADAVGWARLLLLMVAAIVAMVAWIIVAHHLWERPDDTDQRKWAALYNGVTVLTVSTAVFAAYAILYALIFLAAWVFVPSGYLQSTLKHPVGFGEYVTLAWLGTSLATVAGALGASLEHKEMVREASYGYRQRRRHEDDNDSDEESWSAPVER